MSLLDLVPRVDLKKLIRYEIGATFGLPRLIYVSKRSFPRFSGNIGKQLFAESINTAKSVRKQNLVQSYRETKSA